VHIDPFLRARRVTMMADTWRLRALHPEIADEWDAWRSRHRATSSAMTRSLALSGDAFSLSWVGETQRRPTPKGTVRRITSRRRGFRSADDRGTSVPSKTCRRSTMPGLESSGLGCAYRARAAAELRATEPSPTSWTRPTAKKATDDKASGKPANAARRWPSGAAGAIAESSRQRAGSRSWRKGAGVAWRRRHRTGAVPAMASMERQSLGENCPGAGISAQNNDSCMSRSARTSEAPASRDTLSSRPDANELRTPSTCDERLVRAPTRRQRLRHERGPGAHGREDSQWHQRLRNGHRRAHSQASLSLIVRSLFAVAVSTRWHARRAQLGQRALARYAHTRPLLLQDQASVLRLHVFDGNLVPRSSTRERNPRRLEVIRRTVPRRRPTLPFRRPKRARRRRLRARANAVIARGGRPMPGSSRHPIRQRSRMESPQPPRVRHHLTRRRRRMDSMCTSTSDTVRRCAQPLRAHRHVYSSSANHPSRMRPTSTSSPRFSPIARSRPRSSGRTTAPR